MSRRSQLIVRQVGMSAAHSATTLGPPLYLHMKQVDDPMDHLREINSRGLFRSLAFQLRAAIGTSIRVPFRLVLLPMIFRSRLRGLFVPELPLSWLATRGLGVRFGWALGKGMD